MGSRVVHALWVLSACGRLGFEPVAGGDGAPDGGAPIARCTYEPATGALAYVALTGSDATGDGTSGKPWRTLQVAFEHAAPGTTVLVGPGSYSDAFLVTRQVTPAITLRSEQMYAAVIEVGTDAFFCQGCAGLVVEGFEIRRNTQNTGAAMVHVDSNAHDVVYRNNIMHANTRNATFRVSGGAHTVTLTRNVIANGGTITVHIADGADCVVTDNLIHHTEAVSNGPLLWLENADRAKVYRNIIAGYRSVPENGIVEIRETTGAQLYSNLILGGPASSFGAFMFEASDTVEVIYNTVAGDIPGSAFGLTAVRYNNMASTDLDIEGNIFTDPTGTMDDFGDAQDGDVAVRFLRNLIWNGGNPLPAPDADDLFEPDSDDGPRGDPQIANRVYTPVTWNTSTKRFSDGSPTICDAFAAVAKLGAIPPTSAAAGIDPSQRAIPDLLGFTRPAMASFGALEPTSASP
jgi:hypothetical protein